MQLSPKFTHDCAECAFHGRLDGMDLYTHNTTVILRFGNDGPDYKSFDRQIIACLPADNEFQIALRLIE